MSVSTACRPTFSGRPDAPTRCFATIPVIPVSDSRGSTGPSRSVRFGSARVTALSASSKGTSSSGSGSAPTPTTTVSCHNSELQVWPRCPRRGCGRRCGGRRARSQPGRRWRWSRASRSRGRCRRCGSSRCRRPPRRRRRRPDDEREPAAVLRPGGPPGTPSGVGTPVAVGASGEIVDDALPAAVGPRRDEAGKRLAGGHLAAISPEVGSTARGFSPGAITPIYRCGLPPSVRADTSVATTVPKTAHSTGPPQSHPTRRS